MPPILKLALEQQIERYEKFGTVVPVGYAGNAVCYDARGNGDGKAAPTITGDYNDRISDYTTVVCEEAAGFIPLAGAKACGIGYSEEETPTLRAGSPTACVVCYSQDAYDKYTQTENGVTIKASGGTYGGGSENLICMGFQPQAAKTASISASKQSSPTLQSAKQAAVCYKEKKIYIVRRLTPLECGRLQGMPDWWCADVPHSDSAEYKMWGNGMALPNTLYIMEGFIEKEKEDDL